MARQDVYRLGPPIRPPVCAPAILCCCSAVDEFLFLGAPATSEATATLSLVTNVFQHLGIPVATHKTEGPETCATFLGILIDTQAYELRLPVNKLSRLQALLDRWLPRRSCTKKDLESHRPSITCSYSC